MGLSRLINQVWLSSVSWEGRRKGGRRRKGMKKKEKSTNMKLFYS
jgi:hypothetical protein